MGYTENQYLFFLLANVVLTAVARTIALEVIGNCGDVIRGDKITFVSPSYPNFTKDDLLCTFSLQLSEHTAGIKVEFIDVFMDGHGYTYADGRPGCDSDAFFIRGFKTWAPPPLCGNLTGYSTVIERTRDSIRMEQLNLLWIMSSGKYRWKLKLTQFAQFTNDTKLKDANGTVADSTHGTVKYHKNENSTMGVRNSRIVNGEDTPINHVPWQVSIQYKQSSESVGNKTTNLLCNDFKADRSSSTNIFNNCTNANASSTIFSPVDTDVEEIPARSCTADKHMCGGTIIGHRHILTATHCLYGRGVKNDDFVQLDSIKIVVGVADLCLPANESTFGNSTQEEHEIETVFLHYAYDDFALINDVAVIKLKTSLVFNKNVKPIRLANLGESFNGKEVLASGWGSKKLVADSVQEMPQILQSSHRFLVMNASECQNGIVNEYDAGSSETLFQHPKYLHAADSILCTKTVFSNNSNSEREIHPGAGDSGGPLASEGSGEAVLIGVIGAHFNTSESAKSETEEIDVFHSVAFFRNWIDMAMTH